jgi:hypothetical protein
MAMKKLLVILSLLPFAAKAQSSISHHTAQKMDGDLFHTNMKEDIRLIERTQGYMQDTTVLINHLSDVGLSENPSKLSGTSGSILQSLEGITSTYLR